MRGILLTPLFVATVCAAQYNGPESVEYDPVGDRYFVSNTQTNRIKVRAQDGTVSDFAITPNAPYGLEIMGDVLYACMGNGVRGFSLSTGAQVYYRNLGALFPNGITTDGEFLYITDFNTNARRIYKVDPVGDTHTTLVASTGQQPNGIVWDPFGDRLVVVFWGGNAPIKAYDRDSGEETILVANTGFGNLDGITIDCDGSFLVSSWNPARIVRYDPSFGPAGEDTGIGPLNNPADIDFDLVNLRVCVPNSGDNSLLLEDYDCLTSSLEARLGVSPWHARPNPTKGLLHVEPLAVPMNFGLFDARGLLVLTGVLYPGTPLDLSGLAPGLYDLRIGSLLGSIRVMRE